MLPSIENLRCFRAAAESLNFRAAARSVALTPTAFGQRIKQLEDTLNASLFQRTTRSVALTAAGMALLPYANAVLRAAEDCLRAARGELGPPAIELVLGTRHELGVSWVLPNLPTLRAAHPEATFHLYFGAGEDLLLRVRLREVDCAITSTRFVDPRLDACIVHREDYVFVGARALLKRSPLRKPEHALKHTLIDSSAEMPLFRYWREAADGATLNFEHVLRMGTIAAIEALVVDGTGVAVLPRYLVAARLKRGELREIFPNVRPVSDHFRLVFLANDPRKALFEALANTLRAIPLT